MESIENSAFYSLTSWAEDLVLPEGFTSLGTYSFYRCSALTSLTLPQTLTEIPDYSFYGCSSLAGELAFHPTVTSIGRYAFTGCNGLTAIDVPDSVTYLGALSFADCAGLKTVKVPAEHLQADGAFGARSFYGTVNIENLIVTAGMTGIIPSAGSSSNGGHYYEYGLPYLSRNHLSSITLGEGVKRVGSYTFYQCSNVTHVSIPSSLESIENSAFYSLTSWAENLVLPEGFTSLGTYSFYGCSALTSLTLPASLTAVPSYCFNGCSSIETVALSCSLNSIQSYAFNQCHALSTIIFDDTEDAWEDFKQYISQTGNDAILGINGMNPTIITADGIAYIEPTFILPSGLTTIEAEAFQGIPARYVKAASVSSIGERAFSGMLQITLPESVAEIDGLAFADCPDLVIFTTRGSDTWAWAKSHRITVRSASE